MTTPDERDEYLEPFRVRVRRDAARWHGTLIPEIVIDGAAVLLADVCDLLEARGVQPTDLDTDLAGAMLAGTTGKLRRAWPGPAGQPAAATVRELLDALAERLGEVGQVATVLYGQGEAELPHLPTTPVRVPLVVGIGRHGWDLYARTAGPSPAVWVVAPFGVTGARAVAEVVAAVNRGERGNPLGR